MCVRVDIRQEDQDYLGADTQLVLISSHVFTEPFSCKPGTVWQPLFTYSTCALITAQNENVPHLTRTLQSPMDLSHPGMLIGSSQKLGFLLNQPPCLVTARVSRYLHGVLSFRTSISRMKLPSLTQAGPLPKWVFSPKHAQMATQRTPQPARCDLWYVPLLAS